MVLRLDRVCSHAHAERRHHQALFQDGPLPADLPKAQHECYHPRGAGFQVGTHLQLGHTRVGARSIRNNETTSLGLRMLAFRSLTLGA